MATHIEIQYLTAATTIITIDGLTFVTDPTFSPRGDFKSGSITLTKIKEAPLRVDQVKIPDVVLLSHDHHADNFDTEGKIFASKAKTLLTTNAGFKRLGGNAVGLSSWESKHFKTPGGLDLKITATPARHGPAGIEKIIGDVIGFVITDETNQKDLVYITGDTCWYKGVEQVSEKFKPRVVILYGGAAQTRGPFNLTMNTNDAIETANYFKDSQIVPVHHDGWRHLTQTQDDILKAFEIVGLASRLHLVTPGQRLVF